MASTVKFTGKDGKAASITFPTRALANTYAKTVKGATIVDTDAAVADVQVTKCPEGTPELQREAARAYYTPGTGLYVPPSVAQARASENEAELMAEHFGAARCAGQSMADAQSDWDFVQSRGGR